MYEGQLTFAATLNEYIVQSNNVFTPYGSITLLLLCPRSLLFVTCSHFEERPKLECIPQVILMKAPIRTKTQY